MSVIGRIAKSPHRWSASEIVDLAIEAQYDEPDRRRDPDVPIWLRDVLVLGDADTQLQMEGLLGWWEHAAESDLGMLCEALARIGLTDQAEMLRELERVFPPNAVFEADPGAGKVSSFAERHPKVTDKQYAAVESAERRLWYLDSAGSDLYELLVAHVAAGLGDA